MSEDRVFVEVCQSNYDPRIVVFGQDPDGDDYLCKTYREYEGRAKCLVDRWNCCEGFDGELTPGLLAEMQRDCETLINAITDAHDALKALDSEPTIAEALRDAVAAVETNEHIGCGGRWVQDKTSLYGLADTCNKCGEQRA